MSHVALRRVVIRLLHDPTLVTRLHADPARALGDVPLSAEERAWLLVVPPSAWRTDPERPERVLAALREEFVATLAAAPASGGGFFQSKHFHRAVQERGSLAVAFGAHLAETADVRVAVLACLESAIASVRRAPRTAPRSPSGLVRLAPNVRVIRAARGALEHIAALRRDGTPVPWDAQEQWVLVHGRPDPGDVTLEPLEGALAALLDAAGGPVARTRLEEMACTLGAEAGEAREAIQNLVADGILI